MEREANEFAAQLLMPEQSFWQAVVKTPEIAELASFFQVSSLAIRVRAKELGYQGHNL